MRVKAYMLAGDPNWIEAGVLSWYHLVEEIIISYDLDGLGWTGVPLSPEEALGRLRALDREGKMRFLGGHYAGAAPTPLACETLQRQEALARAGEGADWVLQFDNDEVLASPAHFLQALRQAHRSGRAGLEYPARWLYLQAGGRHFLEGSTRRWQVQADYPGPVAVRPGVRLSSARQIGPEPLFRVQFATREGQADARAQAWVGEDQGLLHFSMVRSRAMIEQKLATWGHADDPLLPRKMQRWLRAGRHPLAASLLSPLQPRRPQGGKESYLRRTALPRALWSEVEKSAEPLRSGSPLPRPVFILAPGETFTPTHSGAIATVTHALGLAAQAEGVRPVVLARRAAVATYPEFTLLEVDYPEAASSGWRLLAQRAERKLFGWTALGQRTYTRGVLRTLEEGGWTRSPLIVANDPEGVVALRQRFPHAFIAHVFHNQLSCKPRARRRYAASADVTLAVSRFTARWVAEHYGLAQDAVALVPNGVDLQRFRPASAEPPGPVVFGFVGRTGREKAPDLLLRAALHVAEQRQDFSLRMVGSNHWGRFEPDAYQEELQRLSGELAGKGIPVVWSGHVARPDLPAELRRMHVQVVPSRWDEPFGLVTLEGMASGLAVIASCTGGTPEVLGSAGLLFGRDSEEELAAAMEALLAAPERRRALGRAARERAAGFSWEGTWQALQSALPLTSGSAPERPEEAEPLLATASSLSA